MSIKTSLMIQRNAAQARLWKPSETYLVPQVMFWSWVSCSAPPFVAVAVAVAVSGVLVMVETEVLYYGFRISNLRQISIGGIRFRWREKLSFTGRV
jgi:hypothetical protein